MFSARALKLRSLVTLGRKGYSSAVQKQSGAESFWNHPAGPKTVFFWAPLFKWGLVFAGIGDLKRPAESISISQCGSLAATGVVWSRYSLVIIPKNYSLFAVNLFVAITNLYQLTRAYKYQLEQKDKTPKKK